MCLVQYTTLGTINTNSGNELQTSFRGNTLPYYPLGPGTAAGQSSAVRMRLIFFFLFLPRSSLFLLHLVNHPGFFIFPLSGVEGGREGEGKCLLE